MNTYYQSFLCFTLLNFQIHTRVIKILNLFHIVHIEADIEIQQSWWLIKYVLQTTCFFCLLLNFIEMGVTTWKKIHVALVAPSYCRHRSISFWLMIYFCQSETLRKENIIWFQNYKYCQVIEFKKFSCEFLVIEVTSDEPTKISIRKLVT